MDTREATVIKQITSLHSLTYGELCSLWRTLYGREPASASRPYLVKRLAYRVQEISYGGLSEQAHKTMDDVLNAHGFDENGGKGSTRRKKEKKQKEGIPVAGTRLIRVWNGKAHEVTITHTGFEYAGKPYRSLSAITKAITGTHWNGRAFFGLKTNVGKRKG